MDKGNPTYEDLEQRIEELERLLIEKGVSDNEDTTHISHRLAQHPKFREHVFHDSLIPMVVTDGKTLKFIDCNQAAIDIFRLGSKEDVIGKSPADMSADLQYDGTSSEEKSQYYDALALKEGAVLFEWRMQRPNGEIWDAEVHLMRFLVEGHPFLQFTLMDISDRKRSEESLKEKSALMEALLDATYEALLVVDENNKRAVVNKQMLKTFSVPKEIAEDEDDSSLLKHAVSMNRDPELFLKKVKYLYDHKDETSDDILELIDGKILQRYSAPIWDDDKYYGRLWSFIDITQSWNTERALKENELFLKAIIQNTPTPIALCNMKGEYQMINKSFCDWHQLKEKEIVGRTSPEIGIVMKPDKEKEISEQIEKNGHVDRMEVEFSTQRGGPYFFLFSCRIIQINNEPMLLILNVDITEKKKIEIELDTHRNNLESLVSERTRELNAQSQELLRTLDKLKATQDQLMHSEKMASLGVLAAGIAHEINNPLNFIKGGALGLSDYLKEHNPKDQEKLDTVVSAINMGVGRAETIVASLNHYSRQNYEKDSACDIHGIIDNTLVMLNTRFRDRIEITKKYSDTPAVVLGNEGELHQVFLNILSNAEQSIENKGVIDIRTRATKNNIIIVISDSGKGIATEALEKIFDPFFTTKGPGEGTGLGLSITYNIIKEHKGQIGYSSKEGVGTTARIELPRKQNP